MLSSTANALYPVRLVRGVPWSGPRYLIVSAAYGGDSANNAVVDRLTGLTWRRCLEGQVWNGSACTGAIQSYAHEAALSRARNQMGWRLPNVKELSSLVDRPRPDPALYNSYFPLVGNPWLWSTSSEVANALNAWSMSTSGGVTTTNRSFVLELRLVLGNN